MTSLIPAWDAGVLAPVEKLAVHQRGLRHLAVSVFVTAGSKILIQRRAMTKYHTPGLWANTCCTHPAWGEAAMVCARRRLRQELGITGLFPTLCGQVEYRAEVGKGLIEHEVVDIFRATATTDLALAPDPDEVSETRWVDLDALVAETIRDPGRFTPWLRIYLAEHRDIIFGPPSSQPGTHPAASRA